MGFAVDRPPQQELIAFVRPYEKVRRALQLVEDGTKDLPAAIPRPDGVARDVCQHPVLATVHAVLVELASGHVIATGETHAAAWLGRTRHILHHPPAQAVDDGQRRALDVQLGAG